MASKYKGSIKLPAGLSKMGNGNYKLVDANDINYCSDIATDSHDKSLVEVIDDIYSTLNSTPKIDYVSQKDRKRYYGIGDSVYVNLRFESGIAGQGRAVISREDVPNFKTVSIDLGDNFILVDTATISGSHTYTVRAWDAYGRQAVYKEDETKKEISYEAVFGGVIFDSTFPTTSSKTAYSPGITSIDDIYCSLKYPSAGIKKIKYTLSYANSGTVIFTDEYDTGVTTSEPWAGTFSISLPEALDVGQYNLELIGIVIDGEDILESSPLLGTIQVLPEQSVGVSILDTNIDPERIIYDTDALFVKFNILTNISTVIEYGLKATLLLEKFNEVTQSYETIISNVMQTLSSGDIRSFTLGKKSSGIYRFTLIGDTMAGIPDKSIIVINFDITETEKSVEYIKENLIAFFDPDTMNNGSVDRANWKDRRAWEEHRTADYYSIKLSNLNYNTNGWLTDEETGGRYLFLNGESYGILRRINALGEETDYNLFSLLSRSENKGVSFEIYYKSKCIGDFDTAVVSCHNEVTNVTNPGFMIKYNNALLSSDRTAIDCYNQVDPKTSKTVLGSGLYEDVWNHIVFTVDKQIRVPANRADEDGYAKETVEIITPKDYDLYNPTYTLNIYINGVRTKTNYFTDYDLFNSSEQLVLNAILRNNIPEHFGECSIKGIRMYSAPLNAAQVLNNYISCMESQEAQKALLDKNDPDTADIPVLRIVRNLPISVDPSSGTQRRATQSPYRVGGKGVPGAGDPDKTFADLMGVTQKPLQKSYWVNCTVWYTYPVYDDNGQVINHITKHWTDVDIYTQGTSSLAYPIKNFKFKLFDTEDGAEVRAVDAKKKKDKKLKTVPFNVLNDAGEVIKDGWYCTAADNTFTLKCDYMEQSHKNNTPTAMMYEKVLDQVIGASSVESYFSPAKDPKYADCYYEKDPTIKKHRDAIAGFPVLLYYNENQGVDPESSALVDYNALSSDENGYYSNDDDVLIGTYMFNLDKSSNALGFELSLGDVANEDRFSEEGIGKFPGLKYDAVSGKYLVTNPLQIDLPIEERGTFLDTDGNPITLNCLPCTSIEGATNSAQPAAASWYTMDEANNYLYRDEDWESSYLRLAWENGYKSQYPEFSDFDAAVQAHLIPGVWTYEEWLVESAESYKDVYKYIKGTFEDRWFFTDEVLDADKLDSATKDLLDFGSILRTINWFKAITDTPEVAVREEDTRRYKFRNEFKNYFNFAYSMTYYLQMMALIQVDNAGKNAMFDQWGDGIWYPRPYDMDTQMGEDNQGRDQIIVSAEINRAQSPAGITGDNAQGANASNLATDAEHKRYDDQYNTPNSKLWNYFAKYFDTEIKEIYSYLRQNYGNTKHIYNTDVIVPLINSYTSDIIGEKFYNIDAGAKYLSQAGYDVNSSGERSPYGEFLYALQGNRDNRYRVVSSQRFIFLDSFFGLKYNDTHVDCLNTYIEFRAESAKTNDISIVVYEPTYVTIDIGSGKDAVITTYIDQFSTYTLPSGGDQFDGISFTLPYRAKSKETKIFASGSIKLVNNLGDTELSYLKYLGNASRLSEVKLPASKLTEVELGNNRYLQTLDLSNSTELRGTLNIAQCKSLRTLNISNTAISSVIFPEGGALKTINLSNTVLPSVELKDLEFLETINLEGCSSTLSTYSLDNCPITILDLSGYTALTKLELKNCKQLETLILRNTSQLATLNITNCENLHTIDLSGCSGSVLQALNLSTLPSLRSLNITDCKNGDNTINILFPIYNISGQPDSGLWGNNFTSFKAGNSALATISYGSIIGETANFSQLSNLLTIDLVQCERLEHIVGLSYTGDLSALFFRCYNLKSICGKLISHSPGETKSANELFALCRYLVLDNIEPITYSGADKDTKLLLDLSEVTTFSYGCEWCYSITYKQLSKLLAQMPNLTTATYMLSFRKDTDRAPDSFAKPSSYIFGAESGGGNTSSETKGIYKTLFAKNTKLSSLAYAFAAGNVVQINSGLLTPCKDTLTSLSNTFYSNTKLTTVSSNFFTSAPSITNIDATFSGCSALATLFPSSHYAIFPANSAITSARSTFYGCKALKKAANVTTTDPEYGLKTLFDNLPNLTRCGFMFYNTAFITGLPNGVLANCTSLTNADALFANNTALVTLPEYLFSVDGTNEANSHSSLASMRALFANSTVLTGRIRTKLLYGANNLKYIGNIYALGDYPSTGRTRLTGMFSNTAVTEYDWDFLAAHPALENIATLFFKGANTTTTSPYSTVSGNNNSALIGFRDNTDTLQNGICVDIFENNNNLIDVRGAFAGNIALEAVMDKTGAAAELALFTPTVKTKLLRADALFANCKALNCNIPNTLFTDCSKLTSIMGAFANCTTLHGQISSEFLAGCFALQNCSYLFFKDIYICNNSSAIQKSIADPCIPIDLFKDCRASLSTVAYMFAGCSVNTNTDIAKQTSGMNGTLPIGTATWEDGEIVVQTPGLLADCYMLSSAQGMFAGCENLHGPIPEDIFYSSADRDFTNLTNISFLFDGCYRMTLNYTFPTAVDGTNWKTVYERYREDRPIADSGYFIPNDWLKFCPNITTLRATFRRVSYPNLSNGDAPVDYGSSDNPNYTVPSLKLDALVFNNQRKVSCINHLFAATTSLAADKLDSNFLRNSLSELQLANRAFTYSRVKSIGDMQYACIFEKNTAQAKNNTISDITHLVYGTNGNAMTGYLPEVTVTLPNVSVSKGGGAYYNQSNTINWGNFTSTDYSKNIDADIKYGSQFIYTVNSTAKGNISGNPLAASYYSQAILLG